jgi:diadenosine hexaphosphate hydrolase (ATP-forming)
MKIQNSKPINQNIRREFSAGGVVYKRLDDNAVWLLGKHSGYHKWVLPKGLIERGERGFETAVREVSEETGVQARLISEKPIHQVKYVYWAEFKLESGDKASVVSYTQSDEKKTRRRVAKYQESGGKKTKVFKGVSFYLMEYESGDPKNHDWEMEDAGWYSYEEAIDLMAFDGEKEALRQAQGKLKNITNDRIS